jgi:CTP synthase (UTP-ammonia lyase)
MKSVPQARIRIVGVFQPTFESHTTISAAVDHAQAADPICPPIVLEWVATSDAEYLSEERLAAYAGWWIAPGSPYRSMTGALRVMRYAREHDVPLLGTCGVW